MLFFKNSYVCPCILSAHRNGKVGVPLLLQDFETVFKIRITVFGFRGFSKVSDNWIIKFVEYSLCQINALMLFLIFRYAHLINVDFFDDLINVLFSLIESGVSCVKFMFYRCLNAQQICSQQ